MIECVRTCLLLSLVSSWVPWFSQVAALCTYLGALTLQVACPSTKLFILISSSLLHLFISSHVHTKLKHVLGSYSCNFIRYFSLILVLVRFFFSFAGFVWFFFISYCFVRCISVSKQFKRFFCFLISFNRFNWQEMGLPCEFGVWCKFWWVLET